MKLGQPNVDQMLRGMSMRQFRDWMIFAELEPFDEVRQDLRIAQVVTTLLNLNRKKGTPAFKVDDVRLMFGDEAGKPKQSPKQQMQVAQMFVALYNDHEDEKDQKKRERARDRSEPRHPVRKATSRR